MNQPDVYILHCSVSANVRQSIQIAFADYKLPADVIETLKKANALSIRPNLSNALKYALDELRLKQRYLYDRCTIHQGDVHFLHADYFEEAIERIEDIKEHAKQANARIASLWNDEFDKWVSTVDNFFSPLISDPEKFALIRQAYLEQFPSKKEFAAPIQVSVVGPYPALLETVDEPITIEQKISNTASINTAQVLEAARLGSRDSSYARIAELVDDLEARPANKVGERVLSDNPKKRGSWQIAYTDLSLAAAHNPTLTTMAKLVGDLIKCGRRMQDAPKGAERIRAFQQYTELREDIRDEAKALTKAADSTQGFEALQMSLSLSNQYQDLINSLNSCESAEELESLQQQVDSQTSVFKHRAKKLEQLFSSVSSTMQARADVSAVAEQLKHTNIQSENDCDF